MDDRRARHRTPAACGGPAQEIRIREGKCRNGVCCTGLRSDLTAAGGTRFDRTASVRLDALRNRDRHWDCASARRRATVTRAISRWPSQPCRCPPPHRPAHNSGRPSRPHLLRAGGHEVGDPSRVLHAKRQIGTLRPCASARRTACANRSDGSSASTASSLQGARPEPRAITSGAQPEGPTSRRNRPRRPCRVPRWPATQQRHEAGAVSRVPRSSRLASAIGTDRNTDPKRRHRTTKATRSRLTDQPIGEDWRANAAYG
jgi:hypothetical protein